MNQISPELLNSPFAPRIENPSANEVAQLEGYWSAIKKHIGFIVEQQKVIPGWLPEFKLVDIN